MSTSNPQSPRGAAATEKQKRRANSCLPCRESKSRCTGGIPCATCLKKRQKPRCVYRNLTPKEVEADELLENTLPEQEEDDLLAFACQQEPGINEDPGHTDDGTLVIPLGEFFGLFSLSRTVDEYRQSARSEGSTQDVVDSLLTTQALLAESTDRQSSSSLQPTVVQSAGAIETSRPLLSIDMDLQLPKHIRWLYSKYVSICQMLDTGRVTQGWTTFPSLMREVELCGMDQERTAEESTSSPEITEACRRLWWHLIDLDLRLSLLVGRKPHLHSNALRFPRPSFSGLKPDEKRLQQSKFDFIQFKMEVLTSINTDHTQATAVPEDRQPKQEVVLKKFERLQEKAPGPSQDGSKDIVHSLAVAEHQLDIHLFSIVFHHHLTRVTSLDQAQQPSGRDKPSAGHPKVVKSRNLRKQSSGKSQKDMFQSARRVMEIFDYIFISDTSRSALSWTQCFGAYLAAVILGIARLRQDVDLSTDSSRIQQTLKVFQELTSAVPALNIAQLVAGSLENLTIALDDLENGRDAPSKSEPLQMKRSPTMSGKPDASSSTARHKGTTDVESIDTSFQRPGKRPNPSGYDVDQHQDKRARFSTKVPPFDGCRPSVPDWSACQEHQYIQQGSSVSDIPMESFHDQSASASFDQPFPHSASTSFTGNEPMEYSNLEYGSSQDGSHHYSSVEPWYHPPMSIHPPMYDRLWQAQGASLTMVGDDGIQHSFYGNPSSMTMNAPHHLDQQLHSQQSMMLNAMGQMNAAHVHDGSLKDNSAIRGPTHTSLGPDQVQPPQNAFYGTVEETQYPAAQHPSSSPIIGNGLTPREGVFVYPADSSRRRSVADINQQQRGGWSVETPANYNDLQTRGKVKPSIDKSRSPPRDGILSPPSEAGPQSRRNSATPRQIGQQGMQASLTQHLDFSLDDYHPPMMLPGHAMHPEEYPGSRRASLARGLDVSMNEVNVNIPPQVNIISEQAAAWQSQRRTPASQTHFDTTDTISYDLEMTYNTQFHQHPHQQQQSLHHHYHHLHHEFPGPPGQIVTTGPYPGERRWWGSS
ncbi:uncharacterized protein A1O9_06790 [Exophiala aquamarina CBS 119918]|uniref:Zn(2)-C6 fungal-type domain-containing protein n=1 Tax=Exophiala aquamarina CBS 119918 TaxID=1182545 RepID=A0A072P9P6_9EURO|nr:uncharacterized protein A1O9_06790 [Exophiala aquamarina CBS 119918]KEF56601.1 hypothetical protein A1O9_06790 [Exophiala aquamarina CBS 119918]